MRNFKIAVFTMFGIASVGVICREIISIRKLDEMIKEAEVHVKALTDKKVLADNVDTSVALTKLEELRTMLDFPPVYSDEEIADVKKKLQDKNYIWEI